MTRSKDKPGTATISPETQRQERWERGWQAVDRIRERNANKNPGDVLANVTEVVEEVRQERYERKQREPHDHC